MSKMFKVLLIALIAIAGCSFGYLAYAGTDVYNDGEWKITSDGDLIPITNNDSAIGSTSYYPKNLTLDAKTRAWWGKVAALTSSSTVAADFATATVFTMTPAISGTFTTSGTGGIPGTIGTFIISSSGTDNENLVFGTGFKSSRSVGTGTTPDKVTTIQFISDGVNWNEVARTERM